ncbi:TatD family hydrolase [Pseudoalteromonas sp. OOF1S-7]|uniref:TatD family hydrolase n=1 Tax=Pseudoalteromonas sp. OOF1S-7 TaxID=2917757 RepID=UPI001EF4A93F|nr:TatD family hydrolase [Pseudoalteromonas sp. OOF1S-7]MCG7534501.1 TatD family hydrolase [Pseudoalteromonas sp. OOF1S-7]
MRFIDTHCHLDFEALRDNLPQHLSEAQALGVVHCVVPGVTLAQCRTLPAFAKLHPGVKVAFGLHPYFMAQHKAGDMTQLVALANLHSSELVAIGECGIDAMVEHVDAQQRLFIEHIALANALGLPLIVHHRKSHHLLAAAFKQLPPLHGGVIHAFSGSLQDASIYLKQGFKLGVGGTISYPRAAKTRTTLAQVPLDALVLETDAPSMPLAGYQGQVNVPKRVVEVFEHLCAIRDESPQVISDALYSSSATLFRI